MTVLFGQMASALRSALIAPGGRQGMAQLALLGCLVLAVPVAVGSEASVLVLRGEAGTDPGTVSKSDLV